MPCTVVLHGLRPVPFGPAIQPLGRVCMTTPHPYLYSSLPIVTCSTGRIVRLNADRLSFPLSTWVYQSHAEGRCCLPFTREVGVDVCGIWKYHLTHMDTQLSKVNATFAAHPPCSTRGFERTGRTPRVGADRLNRGSKRRFCGNVTSLVAKALRETHQQLNPGCWAAALNNVAIHGSLPVECGCSLRGCCLSLRGTK
jgi:hypothetical protein